MGKKAGLKTGYIFYHLCEVNCPAEELSTWHVVVNTESGKDNFTWQSIIFQKPPVDQFLGQIRLNDAFGQDPQDNQDDLRRQQYICYFHH